ncbi:hypothetical protein CORC01_00339 [Colletotrichum orchidophilum]|uniref:Uncharacterized protein n=1 Tax=Colletotrichum orchidophilum TaxID=1209926 RepID=A0A1G4BTB2_9PEZI|nr:uncharacterized protein CORC01_00339 [Colletotrichum orchidophilum]OHF04487.1 hypothetical protein CORC01_00339 [Colletotrichum orchidophilum]
MLGRQVDFPLSSGTLAPWHREQFIQDGSLRRELEYEDNVQPSIGDDDAECLIVTETQFSAGISSQHVGCHSTLEPSLDENLSTLDVSNGNSMLQNPRHDVEEIPWCGSRSWLQLPWSAAAWLLGCLALGIDNFASTEVCDDATAAKKEVKLYQGATPV